MQAAMLQSARQPLTIKDVPPPEISPRDVLVRVQACGVCHTDLLVADGFFQSLGVDRFPLIPGHEVSGVVEAAGADVNHLAPGDRVGVYYLFRCGHCRACLAGEEEACTGPGQPQASG